MLAGYPEIILCIMVIATEDTIITVVRCITIVRTGRIIRDMYTVMTIIRITGNRDTTALRDIITLRNPKETG